MANVQRTTALTVLPEGEPLYSEMATRVEITDEGAGEFVVVSQSRATGLQTIHIDPSEWPAVRQAIETMVGLCVAKG